MKHITRTFLKGLFTLLPLVLSVYVVFWLLGWVESFSRSTFLAFWPDFLYIPGMGVLVVFFVIYIFGTVVDKPVTRWAVAHLEDALSSVPLLKSVYVSIKDFTGFLSPGGKEKADRVVCIRFPGSEAELIGLVTRDDLVGLAEGIAKEGRMAVYLPMSYQIGGYTIFVPKAWVHPVKMGVEEGMRNVLTAWLPGAAESLKSQTSQERPS
ncbi:MAG TPA: hypothetical protein DCL41_04565 [Bdellovibrionales bacterium]|nr:hypothetical protein [Pseudobdellovibrionaceae bacterium]HAG91117.1 hypothetical protein [Bdellovibrionales bacterium]|tara:strand:+ start:861 stop:1487 length:627 start_codon:yes stop_codon:yes gene_type:complete